MRACTRRFWRPWLGSIALCALMPCALALPHAAQAEDTTRATGSAADSGSEPHGRSTPRGTVTGFLTACRAGRWDEAQVYLDLARIPTEQRGERGIQLARQLKSLLDQRAWLDLESLSDEPVGNLEDGLPASRERVATVSGRAGELDVQLERVSSDANGELIWLVSTATLNRLPVFYGELGLTSWIDRLPPVLLDTRFLEVALWQWIGLIALALVSWIASWITASVLLRLVRPIVLRSRNDVDDRLLDLAQAPARVLMGIAAFNVLLPLLHLSVPANELVRESSKFLVIAVIAWLALRVIDFVTELARQRLAAHGRVGASNLVRPGGRAVKVIVIAITFLATLDTFGFDVTAIIAGLGVGGLAVALAAQKTIENMFGGVSVLVDQPVRPGDFCRFGDKIGTVEDIGIRSTRVRTLDRTVITVPNSEFSSLQIENFAARDRIRLITTIGLRYETTPDQLRHAIAGMRRVLLAHAKVLPAPQRVRFVGFGASSLDLEVLAYVDTSDFDQFLAIREDIFLRFMDTVAESGTSFAFPSTTTYFARDTGLDASKRERAEAEVARWRADGRLMFPDFAEDEALALRDSLDWPPTGSPRTLASS